MPALPRPEPATMALFNSWPAAALRLDARGRVQASNAAARTLLGATAAEGVAWPAVLGLDDGAWPAEPTALPGSERWLRLRPAPWGDGPDQLLLLEDATAEVQAQQQVVRLGELLDLTQDFGRLGVWERDVRTLQGRWDRHVYKFWGLDPDDGAPSFDAATRQIVEADRAGLEDAFHQSLAQAGRYAHRYRVQRRDGGLTVLHSQWAVKNGPDGRPAHVVGIMMDDTDAIDLDRERQAMASQLGLAETLAGLIVWRHDLERDRLTFNAAGVALFAGVLDGDSVDASTLRSWVHPDDQVAVHAAAVAAMTADGCTDLELRYRLPGDREVQLMTRRVVQRNARGEPLAVLGVGLDITAQAAATRHARELRDRFELATRTAGIGYWAREGDTERAEWSEQMRALHGLSAAAPVPTLKEWVQRFVHPEDRAAVREQFRVWLTGHAPRVEAELRVVRTDGTVRHLLTHSLQERGGATPVLFGIAIDVTDRRLADIALRHADERAALAARGAGIGTWGLDWRDGHVHWDAQMWRLRGREPRAEPPSSDEILSFVHPEDQQPAARVLRVANATGETLEHQFRVVWPDGSTRWLASRSAVLRDAQGQILRRIGVNWDITAARRAEAERSEREAAEQANQAKSQFLARMSHELRTPLNAVLGFAQLLLLDAPTDAQRQRLDHIRGAGQHLLSLINDVLDLASLDTGELRVDAEPVDLATLVQQTLPLLNPLQARGDIQLTLDIAPLVVQADPVRLRQVLLNLLSNAFKYNRPGGRVQVVARADGEADDAQVLLSVADTGRGMDPDQLRQLFEPFNRLGAQRDGIEGTGIGLAIVKGLLERMHGRIDVQSEPGAGTVFTVRLPAAPAQRLAPARGVLYIEDNPVNTLIVRELMQRRPDIRLLHAADGRSGLALARREQPALVLLDMQLPDMDGQAVLSALRQDPGTADIRCIAVSANVVAADVQRALAAGLAAYWTKPLDAEAFGSAINALFGPAA